MEHKEEMLDPARKWLVCYLKKLICCLRKQSLTHFFIEGLELFKTYPDNILDSDVKKGAEFCEEMLIRSENTIVLPSCTLEKYKSGRFSKFLDPDSGGINAYMILEDIFTKALSELPHDLSDLRARCGFSWKIANLQKSNQKKKIT